jgi:tetratricopeptide (TPR) repeat protein
MDAATRQFHAIKDDYSLVAGELQSLIFSLRLKGRIGDMIAVAKLYTQEFPESAAGHKKLGDLYLRMGNEKQAMKSYQRVLELEPGNPEVTAILKKIEK